MQLIAVVKKKCPKLLKCKERREKEKDLLPIYYINKNCMGWIVAVQIVARTFAKPAEILSVTLSGVSQVLLDTFSLPQKMPFVLPTHVLWVTTQKKKPNRKTFTARKPKTSKTKTPKQNHNTFIKLFLMKQMNKESRLKLKQIMW